jgi:hypothetical protein
MVAETKKRTKVMVSNIRVYRDAVITSAGGRPADSGGAQD